MPSSKKPTTEQGIRDRIGAAIKAAYDRAEKLVSDGSLEAYAHEKLSKETAERALALGAQHHHGRGLALTLALAKTADPTQDIRAYKQGHENGFDARGHDTKATIPFLLSKQLHAATESHWMTRVFAGEPYRKDRPLPTNPPIVGKLLVELVCAMQDEPAHAPASVIAEILLGKMIAERNSGAAVLIRPKNLTIQAALELISKHLRYAFKVPRDAGPRLAQLTMYALYQCLVPSSARYDGWEIGPLERLKAANRKSGTVGDVDVLHRGKPIEAVEVKFAVPITMEHVNAAIEKVQSKDVRRYYILSTAGVLESDAERINKRCKDFFTANGCEIICNGILETLAYYLRLLDSTDGFIAKYIELVAKDKDLTHEHKQAWNIVTGLAAATSDKSEE